MAETLVKVKLLADGSDLKVPEVKPLVDLEQQRLGHIKSINDSLEAQQTRINALNILLDPKILQQRVALTLEEEKAREKLSKATEAEKARQKGPDLKALAGKAGDLAGGGLRAIAGVVGGAASGGVGGAISGAAGAAAEGLSKAGPYGKAAAAVIQGATMMAGALKAVGNQMMSLAAVASPVTMQQYKYAVEDTQAVIGRMFVPVLELATQGVRLLGDTLASILPSSGEIKSMMLPLFDALKEVRPVIAELAPLFRVLVQVGLIPMVVQLKLLGFVVTEVVAGLKLLGLVKGDAKLESSMNAAGRPATIGDTKGFANAQYQAAFSAGISGEPTKSPMEKAVDDIRGFIQEIRDVATRWGGAASGAVEKAGEKVGGAAERTRAAILGFSPFKLF